MQIVRHTLKSYIAMVKGSVGSSAYQHFYASFDGEERDTMNGGATSCAYFVSSILTIFGGLDSTGFVVGSVERRLIDYGWKQVDSPEPGDVVVYEVAEQEGEPHAHIGFYIGDERVVSTSSSKKVVVEHDWLYRDHIQRGVTAIYRGTHILVDTTKVVE